MNEQQEKLSALLDDYQRSDEDRATLDALQTDVNQQYAMQRYQMIGDVMRNELPQRVQLDFAASVKARLAQEPELVNRSEAAGSEDRGASRWWSSLFSKPVAGLAVAASVALVTVSSLQLQTTSNDQSENLAAVDPSSEARVEQLANIPVINSAVRVSRTPPEATATPGMNWKIKRGKPEVQQKLNAYLINHNENSNSLQGIIPQARVVGFDGNR